MAKITILTSSSCKNSNCQELVEYYCKLAGSYISIGMVHYGAVKVRGNSAHAIEVALVQEAKKIEGNIKSNDKVFLMSERATTMTTQQLYQSYCSWEQCRSRLLFVFGGAYGLHSSLYTPQRTALSLSPLTYPHELALVVWMEQLYRVLTLKAGKRYHY